MSIKILNENNFKKETSTGITLIDFYADWCGPCRRMIPTLTEMAKEYSDKITIAKVNVDQNPNLSREFGVRGIPMFVLIEDGVETKRVSGSKSKKQLLEICNIP